MQFIDLIAQQNIIKASLDKNISKVLKDGNYIKGEEVKQIEVKLAEFAGVKYAISCANGTDALQIALMALDLEVGDEVITTAFSFFATAEVIELLGLKPVFVDIEEDSYNIDVTKIEEKITSRTKAIIPVSLYGQCSDMNEINAIAKKHNLVVIEDAAQSFGAMYNSKRSCGLSDLATTSFFPSKPLGCYGDGGMILTDNQDLANKITKITNHGQEGRYNHVVIGVNSRLDTIQAAILLAKFEVFEKELEDRAIAAKLYDSYLADIVKTPKLMNDRTHVYAQYTIQVDDRDSFCKKMADKGIPTAVHYPKPIHLQPVFIKKYKYEVGSFKIAEKVSKRTVSLPMHPYLQEKDIKIVAQAVRESI